MNVRLLHTTFNRGAENGFLQLANMSCNICVVHCMLKLTILGSECFHADHLHCAVWIICCEENLLYLYLALSMIRMIK